MKFTVFLAVVFLANVYSGAAQNDDLTDILAASQRDLNAAHQYFQNQYYYFYSAFKVYLARMVGEMMVDLGDKMNEYNDIVATIGPQVDDAPETCQDMWEFYQIIFGRSLADCTLYAYGEVAFMTFYHNVAIWYSEYMTNNVQTLGMDLFSSWNPLTDPDNDAAAILNQQLRQTLNRFLDEDYPYIRETEDYFFANFDGITQSYELCANQFMNSFNFTSNLLASQVAAGTC